MKTLYYPLYIWASDIPVVGCFNLELPQLPRIVSSNQRIEDFDILRLEFIYLLNEINFLVISIKFWNFAYYRKIYLNIYRVWHVTMRCTEAGNTLYGMISFYRFWKRMVKPWYGSHTTWKMTTICWDFVFAFYFAQNYFK